MKIYKKIAFIATITILIIVSTYIYSANAQQPQTQCPGPKSFPAQGTGTDAKFQDTIALSLWNSIVPTANTQAEVLGSAEIACNTDLANSLSSGASECYKYCTAVPGCQAKSSINGPNSCKGNEQTDCSTELRTIHQTLYNPKYGHYETPLTASFDAWKCTVNQKSAVSCECPNQE